MASRNDITGDLIKTGHNSQQFRDNWELIFGKKENPQTEQEDSKEKNDAQNIPAE